MRILRVWVCRWLRSRLISCDFYGVLRERAGESRLLCSCEMFLLVCSGRSTANALASRYMDQQFSRYVNVSALKNLFNGEYNHQYLPAVYLAITSTDQRDE